MTTAAGTGPTVSIDGVVEPGFGPVADAFRRNFAEHGEVGAQVAVHVDGRLVVDLAGGRRGAIGEDHRALDRPYDHDTVQLVFSCTKGVTAIAALQLVERGELDLDAPVARYWPEFAAAGKADVPVSWLLSHRAGLVSVDDPPPLDDILAWDPIVDALGAQAPLWEPGTAHGYHAITYGWLVGEVIRRITGRSVGRYVADEIVGPLGLRLWIGLPDDQLPHVAPVLAPAPPTDPERLARIVEAYGPGTIGARAISIDGAVPPPGDQVWNTPRVLAAELPAANLVTDARSLSRMYAACVGEVGGVRLVAPDSIELATRTRSEGRDLVHASHTRFGLGFALRSERQPYPSEGAFGHGGAGGSLGFADPQLGVGFGYVMNQMRTGDEPDPRAFGLVGALVDCL